MFKIAIIGGGAAGFFAAIAAKRKQPQAEVTIYEKARHVLAKVGISGGGRCNVTNSFNEVTDLKQVYPRGDKLMKRLFNTFDHNDTYRWFENHGVPLVTQDDQCVFPRSQSSQSIVQCLTRQAAELGIAIRTSHTLQQITPQADGTLLLSFKEGETAVAHRAAVTTGGSPRESGLAYLAALGHRIEQPVPSLFTFNLADTAVCQLMGTVVAPATVSIPGTKLRGQGALLITHWGMSGPAILKLSSQAARYASGCLYRFPVAVNWTGHVKETEEHLQEILIKNPQKHLSSIRPFDLPSRLWLYLIGKTGLAADKKWSELGRKGINKLVETLTNDRYDVSGKSPFREEFVTCGGISLNSINLHTLESRVCPHLYFAGEVLDIDAVTGGFNLQAAWTTGYVAGEHIAETAG